MQGTRVLVADPDGASRREIRELVQRYGYLVVASVGDGRTAAQLIFQREPEVAIISLRLPLRSGLEVARVVGEQLVSAVVLTTDELGWEVLEQARAVGAQALLLKPLTDTVLIPALETAVSAFRRYREVVLENRRLKDELETRRLVERAKGLLMQTRGWNEEEAYSFLRRTSMDKGLPLRRVARAVLEGRLG
ncbi:MAG: ANTAR domain-containing response regulator [Moorellales bacterium]